MSFLRLGFLVALLFIMGACNRIQNDPLVFVVNLSGLDLDVRLGTPSQVHYENLRILDGDATFLQPISGTGLMQLETRIHGVAEWKTWQDNRGEPYMTTIDNRNAYAIVLAPYGFIRVLPMLKSPGNGPHLSFYNASKESIRMMQVASDLNKEIKHYSQAIQPGHLTEFFTFRPGPNGLFWLFETQTQVSDRISFRDDSGEIASVDFRDEHYYLQMIWGSPSDNSVKSRIWDISPVY